ncbi:MAG: D-alanine--D-alanine ligase [Planctomycetes bacterium]|nr:D-alanine--D-alanine ligase [Planctomycetota bacterium]
MKIVDLRGELEPQWLRDGAIVFNIVHGTYGEDGRLQAALDAIGKPYVGSDAAASALCMDKDRTKKRLQDAGIRVPWGVRVHLGSPFSPKDLKLPNHGGLVLKPVGDGSSVGLRIVPNPSFVLPAIEELIAEVGAVPYLIEERLPGPEYTVAVIEDDAGPRALPPICVRPAEGAYDYQAKYTRDDTRYELVQDAELASKLGDIAVRAHRACGCRDVSRTDLMATGDGDVAALEVNTLPGFTDHSLTPKAAAAAGIGFDELVDRLASRAASRSGTSRIPPRTQGHP